MPVNIRLYIVILLPRLYFKLFVKQHQRVQPSLLALLWELASFERRSKKKHIEPQHQHFPNTGLRVPSRAKLLGLMLPGMPRCYGPCSQPLLKDSERGGSPIGRLQQNSEFHMPSRAKLLYAFAGKTSLCLRGQNFSYAFAGKTTLFCLRGQIYLA